jgi:hypothetical protein
VTTGSQEHIRDSQKHHESESCATDVIKDFAHPEKNAK